MANESKIMKLGGKGRWSELPTLLLWMIKDRLNLVGNVLLAAVCKDWNLASASYPPKPQRLAPFIMCRLKDNTTCIFGNVSPMKDGLLCVIPEFDSGTSLLFSRRGWLLLEKACDADTRESSIVLFHLQTNVKLVMPTLEEGTRVLCASFSSIADGTPSCVVLAKCVKAKLTLYVANVGDEKWMKYSHGIGRGVGGFGSVVVVGSKIHCLDIFGGLYTFDKSNLKWRRIKGISKEEKTFCYMMESEEGEIMKVNEHRDSVKSKTYRFFKLDERKSGWDELSEKDSVGRSWFLSSNCHFTVTEDTRVKNVYVLGKFTLLRCDSKCITGSNVFFSDLINGSTNTYFLEEQRQWVDLGRMDKLPHACVIHPVHAGLKEIG